MRKVRRKKPLFWIVRRDWDGRILCTDGLWRLNAGGVEFIKRYIKLGNAMRFVRQSAYEYTFLAVYSGDWLDCCGEIRRDYH